MNILIFDALYGRASATAFLGAIPGNLSNSEIAYKQKSEMTCCNVWKEGWSFYNPIEHFDHAPEDMLMPDREKITGCLQIIDLHLYSYFLLKSGDEERIHADMINDELNSIKWSRHYGLAYAVVMLEHEDKLALDYTRQIQSIYDLSNEDLLLSVNLNRPDTVLEGLEQIKQHFEYFESNKT